jgi:exodeoxyribonuclease V gamma subunit
MPGGRSLIGTVAHHRGGAILVCTYSRLGTRHRLGAWVRFLALSAARPELDATVLTVGRGRGRQPPQIARLGPLAATADERRSRALQELAIVVDLYDRGLRAPLPLFCKTSAAWAEARHQGKDPDAAFNVAQDEWVDGNFPGEISDPEHRYVWGEDFAFGEVTEEPPGPDERGPGWSASERSRFARLACRLWYPVLAHERIEGAR